MPLMLLGEFCRERRGTESWGPPQPAQPDWEKEGLRGRRGGAGTGWVPSGRRHQIHTHFWKSIYVT